MTIDEAIEHSEETAAEKEAQAEFYKTYLSDDVGKLIAITECQDCAHDHRQLAEWLKELRWYQEQDLVLRETTIETAEKIYRTWARRNDLDYIFQKMHDIPRVRYQSEVEALKGNGYEKQGEDYLDLMTAEEARKLDKILKERYVAERIEEAIRRGQSSAFIDVAVSGDLKRRLNNLGYGVDVRSTVTEITWEEMAF
jgi:L-rhamnose mutarotase